jgi:hypothetical protein
MTNSLSVHPELRKETRPIAGSGGDTPVTVIMTYDVPPFRVDGWLRFWERIAVLAARRPACRSFEILRGENFSQGCSIRSAWDDVSSFHRFIRESGLLWLERAMPHPRLHVRITYRYFGYEPAEAPKVLSREKGVSVRF